MEETSLSKIITDYLLENYSIEINTRGNVKVEDFSFTGHGLPKRVFKKFLSDRKDYESIHKPFLTMSDAEIIEELSSVIPTIKDNLLGHVDHLAAASFNEDTGVKTSTESYMSYLPIINVEDPKGSAIMVDKNTGRVSTLEERSWERVVGSKHVALVKEVGHCGKFEYNPRSINAYIQRGTIYGDETIFNKFLPPSYRVERNLKPKLDPRFINFLEGLFLESCRSYAYNWLYYSSFKKIPTYLVLVGAGGIGKNLLAEALKRIHGDTNFTKAPSSALDTKFNGHLEDCTMLYYDECKFSAGREGANTRKNRLKEWANDYVPVEKKGIDSKNRDIFCSAIIATNNDSDVHLEQLDRKFSVMELSEERLEKRIGAEDTYFLWEYLDDPDMPDALLNYLQDKIDPDFNPHMEYKGPKFDKLVVSSLYGWQQDLLFNYVLNTQTPYISLKKCREDISLFPKHTTKIDDFLKNFRWKGEDLGKIVTLEGQQKIKVNEKFCPAKREEHSLNKMEE